MSNKTQYVIYDPVNDGLLVSHVYSWEFINNIDNLLECKFKIITLNDNIDDQCINIIHVADITNDNTNYHIYTIANNAKIDNLLFQRQNTIIQVSNLDNCIVKQISHQSYKYEICNEHIEEAIIILSIIYKICHDVSNQKIELNAKYVDDLINNYNLNCETLIYQTKELSKNQKQKILNKIIIHNVIAEGFIRGMLNHDKSRINNTIKNMVNNFMYSATYKKIAAFVKKLTIIVSIVAKNNYNIPDNLKIRSIISLFATYAILNLVGITQCINTTIDELHDHYTNKDHKCTHKFTTHLDFIYNNYFRHRSTYKL